MGTLLATVRKPGRRAGLAQLIVGLLPLLAWSAIGLGAQMTLGRYGMGAVALVTAGTGLLVVGAAIGWGPRERLTGVVTIGTAIALFVALVVAAVHPAPAYEPGTALAVDHVLTFVAAIVAAVWFIAALPWPRIGAGIAILFGSAAGVAMVVASPRPLNDDWNMMQAVTLGLSRGQNIYSIPWVGPPHEAANLFAYLPGSAVAVWPFRVAFGDARYGILAALVATSVILLLAVGRTRFAPLACLPLLYPESLDGLTQSWIDPLVLLGVCGAGLAVIRRRPGWAVVSLAASLACKQQAWLVVPVAMAWRDFGWRRSLLSAALASGFILPWAATDLHRFVYDVFQYQLRIPARLDSLSLFAAALRHGYHPTLALLVASTAFALLLVLWRIPRDTTGFLFGAALVMSVFNLANKQSFFNEWELAAGLAAAASAFAVAEVRQPASAPVAPSRVRRRGKLVVPTLDGSPAGDTQFEEVHR